MGCGFLALWRKRPSFNISPIKTRLPGIFHLDVERPAERAGAEEP